MCIGVEGEDSRAKISPEYIKITTIQGDVQGEKRVNLGCGAGEYEEKEELF